MGIYYYTLLCVGTLRQDSRDHRGIINKANVTKSVGLSNIDPIIEAHEWKQGFVSMEELKKAVKQVFKDDKFEFPHSEGEDLFLEERRYSTYEFPINIDDPTTTISRYILVAANTTFEQYPGNQ